MHATGTNDFHSISNDSYYKKSTEFISKIGHTILRYRVESAADYVFSKPAANAESQCFLSQKRARTKSEILKNRDNSPLHNRTLSEPAISFIPRNLEELQLNLDTPVEFWKNGIPIYIDVFSKNSFLLERWVLSFQSHVIQNPEIAHANQEDGKPSLDDDMTDLILLIQSLYAEIRCLPLASYLERKLVIKGELQYGISFAHGGLIRHSSPFESQNSSLIAERSFHSHAKLCVFKFRPAVGSKGTLCLHVVHDLNLAGLAKGSSSPSTTPTDKIPPSLMIEHLDIAGITLDTREQKRTTGKGSIISSGSFSVTNRPDKVSDSSLENSKTNLAEPSVNHQPSSPFPSPKAQKRVLAFSQSKLEKPGNIAQRPIPPPIRVRSNLHFNFSNFPSSSDGEMDADGGGNVNEELVQGDIRMKMFSPDRIEIHRSILSQSPSNSPTKEFDHHSKSFEKRPLNRRDSLSSTTSDLFGTFVGSYEESILIGRLSTTPSRPIPFLAEIGVLAIGKCKPYLKCPPHLSVRFSAYFYQLPDEDIPTPYVGTIDMNGSGKNGQGNNEKLSVFQKECLGYRLPLKGQLQIMIKNPSCTAIKVFLIPYDFRDMPPNTKTFIRQKSYAIRNEGYSSTSVSDQQEYQNLAQSSIFPSSLKEKRSNIRPDRLKFAVHLHFQMNSKKSLYLTSQIRVVFSSRPLDGDEKLKIVYQAPNFPKYQELSPVNMGTSPTCMWHTSPTLERTTQEASHVQGR